MAGSASELRRYRIASTAAVADEPLAESAVELPRID